MEKPGKKRKKSKKTVSPFGDGVRETFSGESKYFESASGMTDRLYRSMQNSYAGQLLTSANSEATAGKESLILSLLKSLNLRQRILIPTRKFFNRQFSDSMIIGFANRLLNYLLSLPVRLFGILSLSFGMYVSVIWLVMRYAFGVEGVGYSNLIVGLALTLLALFPLFMKGSLAEAVTGSKILDFLLFGLLGAKRDTFEDVEEKPGKSYLAFLSGMVLSLLTIKVNCIYIISAVPILALAILIIKRPTAGIITILLTVPLVQNTAVTVTLISYTAFCLILKLISGKRVLKTKAADFFVFVFALMIFAAGQLSVSSESTAVSLSFICFIAGYFLTTALVTTKDSYEKCRKAILISSAVSSSYGIIGLLAKEEGLEIISSIFVRSEAYSSSSACFIMITLPMVISFLFTAKSSETRFGAALTLCLGIAYLIIKLSGGALIGLIVGLLVFLLFSDRKAFAVTAGLFFIAGLAYYSFFNWLPEEVIDVFNRLSVTNSFSSSRINGIIDLINNCFVSGVGVGPDAFSTAYRELSANPVITSGHANNMFVQITAEIGIGGVVAFAVSLIFSLREPLYFMKNRSPGGAYKNAVISSSACLGGVLAAVIYGSTAFVWHNSVTMPIFWILLGLSCSTVRAAQAEETKLIIEGPFAELYYPR